MINATHAMKMNITFCRSPIPKKKNVSGIKAASGMLRPKITTRERGRRGSRKSNRPGCPSGTPTASARANPSVTRRSVTNVLRVSALSNHNERNSANVSRGLGSNVGLMIRCSFSPTVSNHHSRKNSTTDSAAKNTAATTEIGCRRRGPRPAPVDAPRSQLVRIPSP